MLRVKVQRRRARLEVGEGRYARIEGQVLAAYKIAPLRYSIVLPDNGMPVLVVEEPEPDEAQSERLREIMAGLAEPRNDVERYYAQKAKSGYGPIYPLMRDPHIEEIALSGPSRKIAVMHKMIPSRWIETNIRLDEEEVNGLAMQLARKAGRILSIASPYAEGLTVDGYRISVTMSKEVSRFGSTFVVRKYPEKPLTIGDLIASRTLSPLMAAYLWILVESQAFLVIIGNMGAGKTSVLQSLAGLIPPYNRVLTIEDTPELSLLNDYWDSLVTRPKPPGEEIEEVSLEDLLRFALRRRAEYVIVGEVRGRETRLLAQAAASGHGSMTTFHADSPEGAILRLSLDPINLPPLFLRLITAFVHVRRIPVYGGKAKRRIVSVTEVVGDDLLEVFKWDPHLDAFKPAEPGEVVEASVKLKEAWERLGVPHHDLARELGERAELIEKLAGAEPERVNEAIRSFYLSRYGVPRP
ncbi:MAG: type II/IV secretion system ATPase subunit [Desulfurococcales archaeon]|nr:type II/IV secretion system ATPase subunit [Desulfurococcales archaeon]